MHLMFGLHRFVPSSDWFRFSVEVLVIAPLVFTSFHHLFAIYIYLVLEFRHHKTCGTPRICCIPCHLLYLQLVHILYLGNLPHVISGAGRIHSWGFRHNQLGDESCQILAAQLCEWAEVASASILETDV